MSTVLEQSLPIDRLRAELRDHWQNIKPDTRLDITYRGGVVGVWMAAEAAEALPIDKYESASVAEFRANLSRYWMDFKADLDCVFLVFYGQRRAALVNPRLLNNH
jgi:hypothetical protein